jgi:hypothetical protein
MIPGWLLPGSNQTSSTPLAVGTYAMTVAIGGVLLRSSIITDCVEVPLQPSNIWWSVPIARPAGPPKGGAQPAAVIVTTCSTWNGSFAEILAKDI